MGSPALTVLFLVCSIVVLWGLFRSDLFALIERTRIKCRWKKVRILTSEDIRKIKLD